MKTLDLVIIGKRVRRCREQLGYTREQFSEQVSISPQFLAEIENGKKGISAETLYKICTRFQLSANYILLGQTDTKLFSDPIQNTILSLPDNYLSLAEDIIELIAQAASNEQFSR